MPRYWVEARREAYWSGYIEADNKELAEDEAIDNLELYETDDATATEEEI